MSSGDKVGKAWGQTQLIFHNETTEISRLEIEKGGYCSKHVHDGKFNKFFVESGKLQIETWKNDYDLCDVTVIAAGEMTTIAPGEKHRFTALEKTIAYEFYWVNLSLDDIKRDSCGGIKSLE